MKSKNFKKRDLKRWNLIQMSLMARLGIILEPEQVFLFGKWFAQQVDHLDRLPRWSEVQSELDSAPSDLNLRSSGF